MSYNLMKQKQGKWNRFYSDWYYMGFNYKMIYYNTYSTLLLLVIHNKNAEI